MSKEIIAGVGRSMGEKSQEVGSSAAHQALDQLQKKTTQDVSLAIVFASPKYNQEEVVSGVRSVCSVPLVGSSTAGEITQDGPSSDTVVVMFLSAPGVAFGTSLSTNIAEVGSHEAGSSLAQSLLKNDPQMSSVLIFMDVLVGNGADVIRGMQSVLGKEFPIVGGASGDNQKFEKTFQYHNDSVSSQSIVACSLSGDFSFGVGVRHGWIPIGLPMKVTSSRGATVHEIDDKPAVEVYKNYFGESNTKHLEDDKAVYTNKSLLSYPFGISKSGEEEILIRFATDVSSEGSITCAAEIPQGSEIRMMIGNKDKAIEASQIAARQAKEALSSDQSPGCVIIFNCIARHNLFGEEANQEIQAIRQIVGSDVPIIGFYTYGEQAPVRGISRDIKDCESSFHNETVVIYALQ